MTAKHGDPPPLPFSSSPFPVRIGAVSDPGPFAANVVQHSVYKCLERLRHLLGGTQYKYVVLSPLAQPADDLLVQCVLDQHSQHEPLQSLPAQSLSEQCDILFAVRDPRHKNSAAAKIVESAKSHNVTVFEIDPARDKFWQQSNGRDLVSQLEALHEYNSSEPPGDTPVSAEVEGAFSKLECQAKDSELDTATLLPLRDTVLPHMAKASRLAESHQNCYLGCEKWGYVLSASAVATAAVLSVFPPHAHEWWLLEAAEIATILALTWPSLQEKRLRKWIEYRYLAERLRAACFLYVAGLKEEIVDPPVDLQLSWLPHNWVMAAIRESCVRLPSKQQHQLLRDPLPAARVTRFIRSAWIEHQRSYYHDKAEKNRKRNEQTEWFLRCLLVITLAAPFAHAFLPFEGLSRFLILCAIILPACAGAAAGISVFQHYNRNAERYESMSRHLREISSRLSSDIKAVERPLETEPTLTPLQQLVREADRAMLHEHQGWRAVFGVRLPGPG